MGLKLRYLGVNHFYALVTGYADAVVPVFDEVGGPDLVQAYRR